MANYSFPTHSNNLLANNETLETSSTWDVINLGDTDLLFDLGSTEINYTGADSGRIDDGFEVSYSFSYGDTVWGTPNSDADYWRHQEGDATCAIVAQISIYESITGERITEYVAADFAEYQGWFDPQGGTPSQDGDNILNYLGVETEQYDEYDNCDINTIATALDNGDKVIASIDAREIWDPLYSNITGLPIDQLDDLGHAVWVTGIVEHADNSIDVILNDSGTIDGQLEVVGYWDFMNAWNDRNNFLTIVDV